MASAYLSRSTTTSTNNTKFTISVWVKKLKQVSNSYQNIINSRQSGGSSGLGLWFGDNDEIFYNFGTSSTASSSCQTNAKYRDNSGWYHIVVAGDASQSGTDKLKFYVNGEQITSFQTDNRSSFTTIAYDIGDTTYPTIIGRKHDNTFHFDGSMAHFHFVDGTAYQASTFGETDSTTGIWIPKTSPSVTYGNNGFFLKFENSAAMGTDSSGNSNTFTVNGSITQLIDTPSNVFATWNPLARFNGNFNFSNGNTSVSAPSGTWNGSIATMGFTKGKWYWEAKFSGNADNQYIGVFDESANTATNNPMSRTGTTAFYNYDGGEMIKDGSFTTADYGTITSSQICGVAVDADNNTISIYRDGVAIVSNYALSTTKNLLFPFISVYNTTADYNFGNGYFGTTAVSSAQNPDDGIGIFEYDVPAGYRALCTKSINAEEYS